MMAEAVALKNMDARCEYERGAMFSVVTNVILVAIDAWVFDRLETSKIKM